LSFCRPSRGTRRALAYAQQLLLQQNCTTWLIEDLRHAFDRVPRQRLEQILNRYILNEAFCRFVVSLAQAPTRKGILQGSSLSMLLLDVYLTHLLHRPWRRHGDHPALLRYADDLLLPCQPQDDLPKTYERLTECIRDAGMAPKHGPEKAVVDLRYQTAQWLGYRLRLVRGRLEIRSQLFDPPTTGTAHRTHEFLVDKFTRLHERADSWRHANAVVNGIIAYLAPTLPFTDPRSIYEQIVQAGHESGFDEFQLYGDAFAKWQAAHDRWQTLCQGVAVRMEQFPTDQSFRRGGRVRAAL
jgi:hypothetical protein